MAGIFDASDAQQRDSRAFEEARPVFGNKSRADVISAKLPGVKRRQLETLNRLREGETEASAQQLGQRMQESTQSAQRLEARRADRVGEHTARRATSAEQLSQAQASGTTAEALQYLASYERASRQRESELAQKERQAEGELRSALEREQRARDIAIAAKAEARVSERAVELRRGREQTARELREQDEALDAWSSRGRE